MVADVKCCWKVFLATLFGSDLFGKLFAHVYVVHLEKAIISKLKKAGVDFGNVQVSQLAQTLLGKAIVVTGSVEGFTREEAEAAIKDRGGKSPGSVSAKTYCVVVGSDPGASKVTKANELKIPIIDAARFQQLLDSGTI